MTARAPGKRRRLLLFAAILIPGVVLIALTVRVIHQEQELIEKRIAEDRRNATEQFRLDLAARLDTIRLQQEAQLQGAPRSAESNQKAPSPHSPILFVAALENDRLIPPWQWEKRPPVSQRVTGYITAGEMLEFRQADLDGARNAYTYGLSSSASAEDRCVSWLHLGRVLLQKARNAEAHDIYRQMLTECEDVPDDEGVSLSLYSAERLVTTGLDIQSARSLVLQREKKGLWPPPVEAHLMRSLLQGAQEPAAREAFQRLSAEIALDDQIATFSADLRLMGGLEVPLHATTRTAWLSYGTAPWLVTRISTSGPKAGSVVLAVLPSKLGIPGAQFLPAASAEGLPVGEGFADLRITWDAGRFAAPSVPVAFYSLGILLILGATGLAGFLLLRDVAREIQIAEMRSSFVASVSHELKTPLTAIRMFSETLALGRTANSEVQTEYLQTIVSESERLSRLVDNVLDFSRIEQDRKIYQMRQVCLAEVAHSAVRAIHYPLVRQNFNLSVDIAEGLPQVTADPDALEQAMLNLLANAVKYSGDAREIGLTLRRDGRDAVIEVSDHGFGIAKEHHKRIFDKFYRVRSEETDRVPGAGLGLTLVAHAIKAHHGHLTVSSAPGKGSTFSIRIPLTPEGAQA